VLWGDFVLLTPIDVLTRDDTWISFNDMVGRFSEIPEALPDAQLRAQMLNYIGQHLSSKPTKEDRDAAAIATLRQYPELLDYYIRLREDSGDQAESRSLDKVSETLAVFVEQIKRVVDDLKAKTVRTWGASGLGRAIEPEGNVSAASTRR